MINEFGERMSQGARLASSPRSPPFGDRALSMVRALAER